MSKPMSEKTTLYFRQGSGDKVYQAAIQPSGDKFIVTFAFGRRGSTLNTGTASGLFDGQNPAITDVLIKYTYYGDANLDGKIDGSDYSRIDNGYLNKLTGWFNGDFNYDGVVNGSDYTLIDNAFNQQGASLAASTSPQMATSTAEIALPPGFKRDSESASKGQAIGRSRGVSAPSVFSTGTPITFAESGQSIELSMQKKDLLDGLADMPGSVVS